MLTVESGESKVWGGGGNSSEEYCFAVEENLIIMSVQ